MDSRHVVLVVVNILKSLAAQPWDWDPFRCYTTMSSLTAWVKLCLLLLLFLFFSFASIQIPIINCYYYYLSTTWEIQIQLGRFSAIFSLSLIALIVFPQVLFWYVHVLIVVFSLWSPWIFQAFQSLLDWLQGLLLLVPICNILVTANITHTPSIELDFVDQPTLNDTGGDGDNLQAEQV